MRSVVIGVIALAASVAPAPSRIGPPPAHAERCSPGVSYAPTPPARDAIPKNVGVYGTSVEATRLETGEVVRITADGATTALRRPAHLDSRAGLEPDVAADSGAKRKYLPVLFSALVPGAGEVSMGYYKRGIALMAVEVGAWSGYFYKHGQGLDTRDEYEAFADANWDQRRWIDNHYLVYPTTDLTLEELEQIGRDSSGSGVWPGYSPWVSKEDDKQHYYENIGKYDWYVSGWSDYVPGTRPDDVAPGAALSSLREEYRSMRHESNDQLDAANRFIYLSIAARVFSIVQTTLLVNKSPDSDSAGVENGFMFRARSRGYASGEVALEYWFK